MMISHTPTRSLTLLITVLMAACTQGPSDNDDSEGAICDKCDMLNEHNDPANLGYTIVYELADESLVGVNLASDLVPYSPPTYFPFTSDGINNRRDSASPAEKYDLAFSGWQPPEGFFELERLESTSDQDFDQSYYDELGPVASWEHFEHGLGRLHDGVDNDGDDQIDFDDNDNEGLEGWFGYCNGNTAASLSVPGPEHNATVGEVEFTPYDIKALLGAVYYGDRSTIAGLRCNASQPAKDEYGRYVDQSWYRVTEGEDTELVVFEVIQGPVYYDETQETVAYVIELSEQEGQRAIIRLTMDQFMAYGQDVKNGEISLDENTFSPIEFSLVGRGCRDTNPASLYLAVTQLLGKYRIPFGIDADSGSHVWNYPIYEAIINEQREIEKEEANRILGVEEEVDYPFNDQASRFVYVDLSLLESHRLNVEMVLELDAEGRVIGGEWSSGSRTRHPDFIWVPMGADQTGYNTLGTYMTFGDDQLDGEGEGENISYSDAPDMRYSDVRYVLQASRTAEDETFGRFDGETAVVPESRTAELTVTVEHEALLEVREALVYMDIEADFTPGLRISVVSPAGVEVSLLDIPYQSRDWAPGRFPTGWDLGVVRGVAHPMPLADEGGELYPGLSQLEGEEANGDWTLRVFNEAGGAAQVNGWSLWLTTAEPIE